MKHAQRAISKKKNFMYSEHRGSWPAIILFPMSNNVKDFIWHIDFGMVPVK